MARPRNEIMGGDERLYKSDRSDRDASDLTRTTDDGTAFSAAERRRMLRAEWVQEKLPSAPNLPGFHVCWLTTNSQYDPLAKRFRLGYTLVKANEVEGFESLAMTAGEFTGCISCNEMVLAKIPMEIYQEIMAEFGHLQPRESEETIKQSLEQRGAMYEADKGAVDGYKELARLSRTPHFA